MYTRYNTVFSEMQNIFGKNSVIFLTNSLFLCALFIICSHAVHSLFILFVYTLTIKDNYDDAT